MKKLELKGILGKTEIIVGGSFEDLRKRVLAGRTVIITDDMVHRTHGKRFPEGEIIKIPAGEEAKDLRIVEEVYKRFLEIGVDRSYLILGIGGGAVCDVTGFASSTYMRGVKFGFIPTTLLAQGDASIGGKNGVNFSGFKNIIGTIAHPEFVLCDLRFLSTLSGREVRSGFAEIIKHGIIGDAELFTLLEKNWRKAISLEPELIEDLLYRSISVKVSIVERDEFDHGERRKLNLGHTFGHAIESVYGLTHGESVSVGISLAAKISTMRGMLDPREEKRITSLLEVYGLPAGVNADLSPVLDAIHRDKKKSGTTINLILLRGIGNAEIVNIPLKDIKRILADLNTSLTRA